MALTAPATSTTDTVTLRPRWPRCLRTLAYGGDYNPEQWPEEVWHEDARLMREAGVNLVSVGIFSWARLEPEEGRFTLDWLARVLDLLHEHEVRVDLATPTAAPPAWFLAGYPQARPVTSEGVVLGGGSRQTFCPSSPDYADATVRITEAIAERFHDHPALELWHVHNEYGAHLGHCFCSTCAVAFRTWLRGRYDDDLDTLNDAWGTAFWSQHYHDWDHIEPPRRSTAAVNPSHQLDYHRFMSDTYLACYVRERDVIRRWSPDVPVTTNFMASTCKTIDYWSWAREVDVVSNDHYLRAEESDNHIDLALAADLTRSLAGGRPWLLMEHSTSAVNWQPRNLAKRPGEMARNSLSHIARGADGALFFQWRASERGAEKFHSAMVPHGGPRGRLWDEVVGLGSRLRALRDLQGTRTSAEVAILWDWASYWAMELEWRPSVDLRHLDEIRAYHERLFRANVTSDLVHPEDDLSRYRVVLAPTTYLLTRDGASNLRRFVEGGGQLVATYFSGIVDEHESIHPGGYPGALRELLGIWVEEFAPLRRDEVVTLDSGAHGAVWAEHVVDEGASVLHRYLDGPAADGPAVTRNDVGDGAAWYVSTRLRGSDLDGLLDRVLEEAGLVAVRIPDVEIVRRRADDGETFTVLLNHGDAERSVPLAGTDAESGAVYESAVTVPAGEVVVVREPREAE